MASRKLEDLYEPLRLVLVDALELASLRGLNILITCTLRSIDEQRALYAQGRESLEVVNLLRKKVGLPPITEKQNRKVTWTMRSYHCTIPKAMAFDFAVLKSPKEVIWDIKSDINKNQIYDYEEFARICQSIDSENIQWGGDWDSPDYPHIQWKNGLNIKQLG